VWLDMDQQDLDDAYDQSVYAPNRDQILKRCVCNSELVRERLGPPKRFAYGPTTIEALDVFTARVPNAPVSIFVHGGVWRAGLAKNYAYAAEMFVDAGLCRGGKAHRAAAHRGAGCACSRHFGNSGAPASK